MISSLLPPATRLWLWFCVLGASLAVPKGTGTGAASKVRLVDLSRVEVPYGTAWKWQQSLLEHHMKLQDTDNSGILGHVLLMQHKSVYTLGSQTQDDWLRERNKHADLEYETFEVERGGQATYHGPGQLVMYPIIDLNYFERDINLYLRSLEETVIKTAEDFGITAQRQEGLTGVWVGDSKISAIGIKLRRWVTMHGLSLNVDPDLRYFDNIVPCGITNKAIGRLVDLNDNVNIENAADGLLSNFQHEFGVKLVDEFTDRGNSISVDARNGRNSQDDTRESKEYQQRCMKYLDALVLSTS